jgi:hypothetical protein
VIIEPGSGGFLDGAIARIRQWDLARPRTSQVAVGWSEVGGCRAALGFRLAGDLVSDEPDTWGAIRGTTIHELLGPVLAGEGVRTELDTEYRGIPGHADIVGPDFLGDIKTTKLASSRMWRDKPEVLRQKRVQAHGYAAGLIDAGELPLAARVMLLVIPVDGTFADWWAWQEPFDRALADEGADRLEWVRARMAAGEPLPKDEPYWFCESWCEFFSICREPGDDDGTDTVITNPDLIAAVAAYAQARDQETAARKRKDAVASEIRGLRGIAGEYRVGLSREGDKAEVLDEAWIRADYESRGEIVPVTWKPGRPPSLSVTRVRKAGGGDR